MKIKNVLQEMKRIRAGYDPKMHSFWAWAFYIINKVPSIIVMRIRMAIK